MDLVLSHGGTVLFIKENGNKNKQHGTGEVIAKSGKTKKGKWNKGKREKWLE